jgi:N-acetylneuraminic acid mutarotase/uncharacterized protein (DUF2141 family)
VNVTSVTVRASGSGNDALGVSAVKLFRDTNGNGVVDTGEVQLGSSQTYAADNGSATFSGLSLQVAANSRENLLVTQDFAGNALAGQTFAASIATGDSVVARGVTSGVTIVPGGAAGGPVKTILQPAATVSIGVNNPGATTEFANASGVPMLQATVGVPNDAIRITSVNLSTSGTAVDNTAFAAVRLIQDANGNAVRDVGEVQLGSGVFLADNGTVTFSGLSVVIATGSTLNLLVVADLSGTASVGQNATFSLTALAAVGNVSGASAAVTGLPIGGLPKTVAAAFNIWQATTVVGAPSARAFHTAVSTGSAMIVFGGEDSVGLLATGARYDPGSRIWVALPTSGAPEAREFHSAAFASNTMVVFGGFNGTSFLSNGAGYDTTTNTWRTLETLGAPTARADATMVSTGSRVLVWGGRGPGAVNTGAIYDPTTNTWSAMSTVGAPAARYFHTAVWTGTDMIVWGGTDGATYLNSGARYTLATDTWSALPAPPVAMGVTFHTAVWTGSEMVLNGGYNGTSYLATVLAYAPSSNTWRVPSSTGAPTARAQHVSVYTGRFVITWGGMDNFLSTGARLNVLVNQWSAMTNQDAPVGRYGHTAVFLGGTMIVWGGLTASSYLNTGGQYTP